ncbi:MAG: TIR domain-containing protein [Acidobacteria bacterium]|nr:TIR domain-containing protein [Acidobacteriota bacterium]
MAIPIPLQVDIFWHPDDGPCGEIAKTVYRALNRDALDPCLPGIGIPVFFSSPTAAVREPALRAPEVQCDLRVALLTSAFVLDEHWQAYLALNRHQVRKNRNHSTLLECGLGHRLLDGPELGIQLSPNAAPAELAKTVLEHTLLQACRLLAGRVRANPATRGAAPLKLFLSHTKRDKAGRTIATRLKNQLESLAADRFFDEVSIQPGDDIRGELDANIADAALVAIRTDRFVSSPWCRREVAFAKRHGRPIVVIDALTNAEPRSSPLLANLPTLRMNPGALEPDELRRATNFLGLEVLRFLHASRHLALLAENSLVPPGATVLVRPPETRDLSLLIGTTKRHDTPATNTVFLYPDPVLGPEEAEDLEAYGVTLLTPSGRWGHVLKGLRLGLSVGTVDELTLRTLGLSDLHLTDAVRVLSRQALATGANLVYGGALELTGPSDDSTNLVSALFEMIGIYNRAGTVEFPPLDNYTAWPFWQGVSLDWLATRRHMLRVRRLPAPPAARDQANADVTSLRKTPWGRCLIGLSLSTTRRQLAAATAARIALGGARHRFLGLLPGVVEEALLTLDHRRPLYVIGGFGGAASELAALLLGRPAPSLSFEHQAKYTPGYTETIAAYQAHRSAHPGLPPVDYPTIVDRLARHGLAGLAAANGLNEEENRTLLTTRNLDVAVHLVMSGLTRIWDPKQKR